MKIALILFGIIIIAIIFFIYKPINQIENGVLCSEESRLIGCDTIYSPVCGWFDAKRINCVSFPCASDFSNECEACSNPDVSYWTQGECPNKVRTECDAQNPCESGECLVLPEDRTPKCYESGEEACKIACGDQVCSIAESYPGQIFCN